MATRQRKVRSEQTPKAVSVPHHVSKSSQSKGDEEKSKVMKSTIRGQPVWIILAIASGACAAINGVFAKLTTTSLTANFASYLSGIVGLEPDNRPINLGLRGTFFGLNLVFNGIMWALFTAALTKGNSTTRVSIVNVSANFFVTAILGWAIFSEQLPLGWWMGASLLAAGNVVIGRREEGETKGDSAVQGQAEQGVGLMREETQEDLIELDRSS